MPSQPNMNLGLSPKYLRLILVMVMALIPTLVDCSINKANSNHSANYEASTREILDIATGRMQTIWNMKQRIFLQLTSKGKSPLGGQAPSKQEVEMETYHLMYELAANLSVVPVKELEDPLLRRRVQRLSKLQLQGLRPRNYEQAKDLMRAMRNFVSGPLVCTFEECTTRRPLAMYPHIVNKNMRAKHYEDLVLNWFSWRRAINDKDTAKSTFIDYVRLLRIAATYNGHVTPSRTWYLHYDTENFQAEMEAVVWEIMPLYRELHAYLRHEVQVTYPKADTKSDGAIVAPVMDQILSQDWYPHQFFRTPHPSRQHQLPSVHRRLEEVLVTPVKINKKAAEFFESLGLNHISDGFYDRYSRRMNDDEGGPDCKSQVYYFPPDVALRYCPKLDYKKMMQIHGTMAELQYNIYKRNLPFGLDTEPCPGFGSALAETVVLASGTARHLHRLHILLNESLTEEQSLNRLFRMGVHTLVAVPQYFINDKFLVDVMDGRIGVKEYNCAYWRLQDKFAGVQPPALHSSKDFDPDFKFYRGMNPETSNTKKFLSEILGFQFYRSFCLVSGQYKPGDAKFPLHNCDFYDSKEAGDMMREMMQLGASRHWRDVMEIATGERKLSGRGILEYFAPLFTWLKERNKQLDIEPGWDADDLCRKE
ncbi:angiotensin-converting enzyme [Drosophila pseudoobscura]|uniref:Angiotensin-converting enzyme n=1 Tax=Drosophila pseudoobscura pseudoobscura TaxID=46245 RepID=A0A6I8USW9_DROPS|nr:angiotensin-converting enzyme [Drosophila pseudoobscura]